MPAGIDDQNVARIDVSSGNTAHQGFVSVFRAHGESWPGDFSIRTQRLDRVIDALPWADLDAVHSDVKTLGAFDTSHVALNCTKIQRRSFHKEGRKPAAHSHGAAVAALLVGLPANKSWGGLLAGADLFAGNIFEEKDSQVFGNAISMVKGLDWMIGEKVNEINLSIAGASNKVLELSFKMASLSKTVMVAAAGNWGRTDRLGYPVAFDDVVAVTAVGTDRLVYSEANSGAYIDISALGVKIWTAVPGGGTFQSGI